MSITDKQVEEAMESEFDGVECFLLVQEILQTRAENEKLVKLSQRACKLMPKGMALKREFEQALKIKK